MTDYAYCDRYREEEQDTQDVHDIACNYNELADEYDQLTRKAYVVVRWPESQHLMERDWFTEECIPINSESGLEEHGPFAFLVPLRRLVVFESDTYVPDF